MKKHLSFYWRGLISVSLALLFVAIPAQQAVLAICSPSATSGNNTITCDGADDTVDALAGNDTVNGGGGNDSLVGGADNDTLTGGAGNDSLAGGAGNDTYAFDTDSALGTDAVTEASGGGTDRLTFSGSNNDVTVNLATTGNQTVNSNLTLNLTSTQVENVTGGNGNDAITGNTLNNSLSSGNGNDTLTGDAGNDTLAGGNGNDTLSGGAGNDSLTGNAGNDSLTGDSDNDTYAFNTNTALGTDTVTEASGGGTDTLNFTGSNNAVTVNLATTGNQTVNSNLTLNLTSAQVENVTGGNNGDTITGNTLNNTLSGGNGNDTLNGASGNDALTGGAGNDTLIGGTGNDSFAFDTDSALGTDTVSESTGGGTDRLNFAGSNNDLTVNLETTGNQIVNSNLTLNLTSAQVENITSGNGNDTLTGNALNNALSGGTGNDTMTGGAGNDTLIGGTGNDTYAFNTNTSLGADTLTEAVGGGTDSLTFTGSTNDVAINLALTGNQTINSNLTLNMTSAQVENVTGGDGNDTLTGNNSNNTLTGGSGNDTLDGGAGNDTLTGGDGNDTLNTGSGVDTLDAGAGDDEIVVTGTNEAGDTADGGAGVNVFKFSVGATGILSLTSNGEDTLDFSLFGNSVTIDLSNSSQQDVGGGLLLTLNGWFKNVIGSGSDDQITGNDVDNNLDGGNGNDTLNGGNGNDALNGNAGDDQLDGGAGTDSLDGGADFDTVQNYNAEDSHTNIESGLPTPAPEEQNTEKSTNTTDKGNSSEILLIEWGQEITLPCASNVVDAVTRDGHWLRFTGLCGYSVLLNPVDVSQLQNGVDSLGTPLGGVSVTLLQQGKIVNELPFGSKVELTFEVPAVFDGAVYFTDDVAADGNTAWVEVPLTMIDKTHARIILQSTGTYAWFSR